MSPFINVMATKNSAKLRAATAVTRLMPNRPVSRPTIGMHTSTAI